MTKLESPSISDWINYIIYKKNTFEDIINSALTHFYYERIISLTVITIVSAFTLTTLGIAFELNALKGNSPLFLLTLLFLGVDTGLILAHFRLYKIHLKPYRKIAPYRRHFDEFLHEIITGKYNDSREIEDEYNRRFKPVQGLLEDLLRKVKTKKYKS